MKPRLLVYVVLAGLASPVNAGLIDFDSPPSFPDPRGHQVSIGNTYDDLGVDFFSKSTSHPRWNHLFYNNPGWFVIGGYQTPPYYQQTSHMGMRFATPMSEVSMDLFCLDPIEFWVYDEAGQPITGITWLYPYSTWKTKTITAPAGRPISSIEFAGTTLGTVVGMDNLNFEPATGTQGNPILPGSGGGGNPFGFESVPGNGNWFDPVLAEGYVYETDGNSNFVSVQLPTGLPDTDGLYTVWDSVHGSIILPPGSTHDFLSPVEAFTVSGIGPRWAGGFAAAASQVETAALARILTLTPRSAVVWLIIAPGPVKMYTVSPDITAPKYSHSLIGKSWRGDEAR